MLRYVRKDARIYDFSLCRLCGAAGGCDPTGCTTMTCLACGTPQCSSHGLRNGSCAVCLVGLLPGWSGCQADQRCTYSRCAAPAVARGRGRKLICLEHLLRQKPTVIADAMRYRDTAWQAVEVDK